VSGLDTKGLQIIGRGYFRLRFERLFLGGFNVRSRQNFFEGSVHSTPEKFENGVFTLKRYQIFSVHTTPEEFKNAAIIGHFGFVFA